MGNPWKKRAYAFNKKRARTDEMAADLAALLEALPRGVTKQLEKDEICGGIIRKYIGEVN